MSHSPKEEQARIIGQLAGIYKNSNALLTPMINQVDFEKAINEDNIDFYLDNIVKGFAAETIKKMDNSDDIQKSELEAESKKDLGRLQYVTVVFDNMHKGVYVDVIDTETNTYKDNAINRKFNRVGQKSN